MLLLEKSENMVYIIENSDGTVRICDLKVRLWIFPQNEKQHPNNKEKTR